MAILKTANGTGKYYDDNSRASVINYILNPHKTPGNYTGTVGLLSYDYADEMEQTAISFNKNKGVKLRHFVIAFESYEVKDPLTAFQIAYRIAKYLGREYQTVFSVHEDTSQLHIHIVINSVSYIDGHRYRGTREEFYALRKYIDNILKHYGIGEIRYVSNKCY